MPQTTSIIVFVHGIRQQIAYFLKALQYQNHTWSNLDVYLVTSQFENTQDISLIDLPFNAQWILTKSHRLKEQLAEVMCYPLQAYCLITNTQHLPHRDWLNHFLTWKAQSYPYQIGIGNQDYFPQEKQNYLHQAITYLKEAEHSNLLIKQRNFSFYNICLPLEALQSLATALPDLPPHKTLHDWISFYLLQRGYQFEQTTAFSYLGDEKIATYIQSFIQDAKFLPYYCLNNPIFIQLAHQGSRLFNTPTKTLSTWIQQQESQLPGYFKHLEETASFPFISTETRTLYQHKYFQRFVKHLLCVQNYYQIKELLGQSAFENMPKYKALSQRIMSAGLENAEHSQQKFHTINQLPVPIKYKLHEVVDFISILGPPPQKEHRSAYVGNEDINEYIEPPCLYQFIRRDNIHQQINQPKRTVYDWLFLEIGINEIEMLSQFQFFLETRLKIGGLLFLLSNIPHRNKSFSMLIQKNYCYASCPDYQGSYVSVLFKYPSLQTSSDYRFLQL